MYILICGNKMPTRCNRDFYCRFYCLLNMFRAPLCPSSGAQEYYTYVEIKCQLNATEVFIADLIACSTCFGHHYAHHQELKSIIHVEIKCQLDATKVFIADLIACSTCFGHHSSAPDDGYSGARNMLSKQ